MKKYLILKNSNNLYSWEETKSCKKMFNDEFSKKLKEEIKNVLFYKKFFFFFLISIQSFCQSENLIDDFRKYKTTKSSFNLSKISGGLNYPGANIY